MNNPGRRWPFSAASLPSLLSWLLPLALLFTIYVPVLRAWFQLDDFAWLSLRNTLANGRSLWWALFSPQSFGTIRPLSERLYFMVLSSAFGLNPIPFRIVALLTAAACVLLIVYLGQTLGTRPWTGCLAALLWVSNPSLVTPLVWASAYNQALYSLFVLTGLAALVNYLRLRRPVFLVLVWAALILALGANESGIVLAGIGIVYIAVFERRSWRLGVCLAAASAVFVTIHLLVAPLPHGGLYAFQASARPALGAFGQYWLLALGLAQYARIHGIASALPNAIAIALAMGLLAGLAVCVRQRHWVPLFWFGVYVAALVPYIGFPQHVMEYYLFLPSAALALLVATILDRFCGSFRTTIPTFCAIALYAAVPISAAWFIRDWNIDRSLKTRAKVTEVLDAASQLRAQHPASDLYLRGLDDEQFWVAFCYGALARRGLQDIYLAPGAEKDIVLPPPEWCGMKFRPGAQPVTSPHPVEVYDFKTRHTSPLPAP